MKLVREVFAWFKKSWPKGKSYVLSPFCGIGSSWSHKFEVSAQNFL